MLKKLLAITLGNNHRQELNLTTANRNKVIEFMEQSPEGTLFIFQSETPAETAIIMCPGGGLQHVNLEHEGYDYAEWFDTYNITYAVLKYRLPEGNYQIIPEDITRAIHCMHQGLDNKGFIQVGVLGASIGGYMAAYAGVSGVADFQILLYPVISMEDALTHLPSRQRMFGKELTEKEQHTYSLQYQTNDKTAPAFIAVAADDSAVNPGNSLIYAEELLKNGIPFSLHVYPYGGHSFGFNDSFPYKKNYLEELKQWLATI